MNFKLCKLYKNIISSSLAAENVCCKYRLLKCWKVYRLPVLRIWLEVLQPSLVWNLPSVLCLNFIELLLLIFLWADIPVYFRLNIQNRFKICFDPETATGILYILSKRWSLNIFPGICINNNFLMNYLNLKSVYL